jgi:hypothetical protein
MWLNIMAAGLACAIAAPAAAGSPDEPFVGIPNANNNPQVFTGSGFQVGGSVDGRFSRRSSSGSGGVWVNAGEWAAHNNRAWKSDGFNDWWHDRPDRAYPAWMRNNDGCARQYFQGNVLRC